MIDGVCPSWRDSNHSSKDRPCSAQHWNVDYSGFVKMQHNREGRVKPFLTDAETEFHVVLGCFRCWAVPLSRLFKYHAELAPEMGHVSLLLHWHGGFEIYKPTRKYSDCYFAVTAVRCQQFFSSFCSCFVFLEFASVQPHSIYDYNYRQY